MATSLTVHVRCPHCRSTVDAVVDPDTGAEHFAVAYRIEGDELDDRLEDDFVRECELDDRRSRD